MKNLFSFSFVFLFLFSCSTGKNSDNYSFSNSISDEIVYFGKGDLILYQNTKDTFFRRLPDSIFRKMDVFYDSELEIQNTIYFNPIQSFISNWQQNDHLESFFFLNSVDVQACNNGKNVHLPTSVRSYVDTNQIYIDSMYKIHLDVNYTIPFEKYLTPFYFRKYEVTNREYREFIDWVKDSLARTLLIKNGFSDFGTITNSNQIEINWNKKLDWNDSKYESVLASLFKKRSERFYQRKELDITKIVFKSSPDDSIMIYPDTLCFVKDHFSPGMDYLTSQYFWHPAYNNYPIVGISYFQAKAFLHWKEMKINEKLKSEGKDYRVKLDFPNEAQWDMVTTATKIEDELIVFSKEYEKWANYSWITDLKLTQNDFDFVFKSVKKLKDCSDIEDELKLNEIHNLFPVGYSSKNKRFNQMLHYKQNTDIWFLDGNVSEWMDDDFAESWQKVLEKRNKLMLSDSLPEYKLVAQYERYFLNKNDHNGKLVCGSNWLDNRCSSNSMRNTEGLYAKLYVNPHSAHSTIGFRYVVYVLRNER